jgi:hypothetical protein
VAARPLLARTPAVLRALLEDLPDVWLDAPEDPGAWSPRDVAAHLADLESDGWLPRVRAILDHGSGRPMPCVERERFRARYAGAPLKVILADFDTFRRTNLEALDELRLDDDALDATGLHESFDEVHLSNLLATWVVHDLTHLSQISRTLAAQYREEVGPWVEFLSILRPRS